MTRSPLVHIGYHKTGSTWFQQQLYPRVTSHRYLPRRQVQEALLMDHAFAFDVARARSKLGVDAENQPLLLCEEELSGNPHSAGMRGAFSKEVAGRIKTTLPDAEIVIFVRNQVEMAAALYRHYVREGGTHAPRRYLCPAQWRTDVARHPFKFPLFSLDYLDYRGLIEHYLGVFGDRRVHVFLFEAFREDPQGFVGRFVDVLGLKAILAELDFSPANLSLGSNAMRLARALSWLSYRSVLDKQWLFRGISNKLRSNLPLMLNRSPLRGRRATAHELLGPELYTAITQRFSESNRALERATGLPLADHGYPVA